MTLRIPRRGELWWANLSQDARSTEIGAGIDKRTQELKVARPVIIVSINEFNEVRQRVSIIPVSNYEDAQEINMFWGAKVPRQEIIEDRRARFNLEYKISFADCGQIQTHNIVRVKSEEDRKNAYGIFHDGYNGTISNRLTLRLQSAIQIALCDNIRSHPYESPVKYGDIIEMDYDPQICQPGRISYLVVSSTGLDYFRYDTWGRPNQGQSRRFSHVIVVVLERRDAFSDAELRDEEKAVTVVVVEEKVGQLIKKTFWLAHCHEIHSVNWESRNAKVIGRASNLLGIRRALSEYLSVPGLLR